MLNAINDFSINKGYRIEFNEIENDICMVLPCGIESKPLKKKALEDVILNALTTENDLALKELFPSEFTFDFFLTIEAWKDLIICERRSPFETEGLTKKEAEWAWILINQWETNPVDTKDEFIDMYAEAKDTFEALGWDAYLDDNSKDKLLSLFSIKTPLLVNYKPSKRILDFYNTIWSPIRINFKKT